jgi:GntR family transcriptional regulator
MQLNIDPASSRPVYVQVIDQIKRDIALSRLIQGDRLPTVRDLAIRLAINPNTMAKAYKLLEQEGVIVTRAGAGAFVATIDSGLNKTVKRRIISESMERTAVDAYHMQVDKTSFSNWFSAVMDKVNLRDP